MSPVVVRGWDMMPRPRVSSFLEVRVLMVYMTQEDVGGRRTPTPLRPPSEIMFTEE